jgi:DNA polymerase family B
MANGEIVLDIYNTKVAFINKILLDTYKFPSFTSYYFNEKTIPISTGKLVYKTLSNFFEFYVCEKTTEKIIFEKKKTEFHLAMAKISVLKITHYDYEKTKLLWGEVFENKDQNLSHYELWCKLSLKDQKKIVDPDRYIDGPMSQASIKEILRKGNNNTSVYNALVTGGRCNSENPLEFALERTADIDLNSYYGSVLRLFSFPVGMPVVYTSSITGKNTMSLKLFLSLNEKYLIDNLYKITVSGKFTFEQDLVYSKVVGAKSVSNAVMKRKKSFETGGYSDKAHLQAEMVLLRGEIQLGVITSDVLELIRKVSSAQELSEWMNLEVVTAVYWDKRDMLESPQQWVDTILNHTGHIKYDHKEGKEKDNRCKKWCLIPLKDFIQPLLDQRKIIKNMMKETDDLELKKILDAEQSTIKLFVNTTYGVIASVYFSINNTVLADNITAKVRCEIWKIAKALGLNQIIADGGFYEVEKVRFLQKDSNKRIRKPSFHTLSNYNKLNKHRDIKRGYLGGINWKYMFENPTELLQIPIDFLATKHIEDFWAPYDIKLKMCIKHKIANYALRASYLSKSNYVFQFLEQSNDGYKWTGRKLAVRRGVEKNVER